MILQDFLCDTEEFIEIIRLSDTMINWEFRMTAIWDHYCFFSL